MQPRLAAEQHTPHALIHLELQLVLGGLLIISSTLITSSCCTIICTPCSQQPGQLKQLLRSASPPRSAGSAAPPLTCEGTAGAVCSQGALLTPQANNSLSMCGLLFSQLEHPCLPPAAAAAGGGNLNRPLPDVLLPPAGVVANPNAGALPVPGADDGNEPKLNAGAPAAPLLLPAAAAGVLEGVAPKPNAGLLAVATAVSPASLPAAAAPKVKPAPLPLLPAVAAAAVLSCPAGMLLLLTPNVNPVAAAAGVLPAAADAGVDPKPGLELGVPNVNPVEGVAAALPLVTGVLPAAPSCGDGSSPPSPPGAAPGVAANMNPKPLAGAGVWPALAVLAEPGVAAVLPGALPGVAALPGAPKLGLGANVTDLRPPPGAPVDLAARDASAPFAAAAAPAGVLIKSLAGDWLLWCCLPGECRLGQP